MIISIGGFAGSGKDTACNYLVEKYGFKKTSYAAPLKQMVKIAFGFTDEQLYGPSSKREEQDERYPTPGICTLCGQQCRDFDAQGPSENDLPEGYRWRCQKCRVNYPRFVNARFALQSLGTEWGRRLHKHIWAKSAINTILASDHDRWCLSDMRFMTEVEAVREARGFNVRLTRGAPQSDHSSETELLSVPPEWFAKVLNNRGTVPELYAMLDAMMDEFSTLHPCKHGITKDCGLCDFDRRLNSKNWTPVIVESPLAAPTPEGVARNKRYAMAVAKNCLERHWAPFASHLLYAQEGLLDDNIPEEREMGIEAGLAWGKAGAKKTVVGTDLGISPGMQRGIDRAKTEGREIVYVTLGPDWDKGL